jgi:hypothetical protein
MYMKKPSLSDFLTGVSGKKGSGLTEKGDLSGTQMVPRQTKARELVCTAMVPGGKLSFGLGQYTTVFQAEVYAVKACVMIGSIEIGTSAFYLTVRLHLKCSTNTRSIPNWSGTATRPSWNWRIITGSNLYAYRGMRVSLGMKQQTSWPRLDLNIHS